MYKGFQGVVMSDLGPTFDGMAADEPIRRKQCCTCKQWQPTTEFNRRARASDGLQSRCRTCFRAWYEANRSLHIDNVRTDRDRRMAETRQSVVDYLRSHPCVDCGERDVCVLEFDHVRGEKSADVAHLMNMGRPWHEIAAEIEKCDVRCCNCHRRVTLKRNRAWRTTDHACESTPLVPLTYELEVFLETFAGTLPVMTDWYWASDDVDVVGIHARGGADVGPPTGGRTHRHALDATGRR